MRAAVVLALASIVLAGVLFGGAVISRFEAEPGLNKVTLRWTTAVESNLKGFEVERGFDGKTFQFVALVEAAGNSSAPRDYVYEDRTVFKSTGHVFYYRLKLVDFDGSFVYYDKVVSVTPQISNVRHTWGSIKAMFR
ncbi:MAG: hypothetical protein ONB17_00890 [candidate division KSB1 bacterium]|nr:hypothetical protein [candidate division KSB1 bacterium]MDZ7294024.1 hypothetical protein [candidate division KSB1 bacterium]MDZ7385815.1 hypothetical protein [candidate division KSB1 bacterium]MDZ7392708.1 hypothetical protein [candidate division KSB1 bacterium]MDZ7412070.1 hypothetical protein [candidate division KSB1 bacterium]